MWKVIVNKSIVGIYWVLYIFCCMFDHLPTILNWCTELEWSQMIFFVLLGKCIQLFLRIFRMKLYISVNCLTSIQSWIKKKKTLGKSSLFCERRLFQIRYYYCEMFKSFRFLFLTSAIVNRSHHGNMDHVPVFIHVSICLCVCVPNICIIDE